MNVANLFNQNSNQSQPVNPFDPSNKPTNSIIPRPTSQNNTQNNFPTNNSQQNPKVQQSNKTNPIIADKNKQNNLQNLHMQQKVKKENGAIIQSFKQLFDSLKGDHGTSKQQIAIEELKSEKYKKIMMEGLGYLECNEEKTKTFQGEHCGKDFFGFSIKELLGNIFYEFNRYSMGDNRVWNVLKCPQLNNFWKVLITNISQICNANPILLAEYLKKYLIKNMIYSKMILTAQKSFNNGIQSRKINYDFIRDLYLGINIVHQQTNIPTNAPKSLPQIDTEHPFYLQLFHFLVYHFYEEHIYFIKIIKLLAIREDDQTNKTRIIFNKYFRQCMMRNSIGMLWTKVKQFSEFSHLESYKVQENQSESTKAQRLKMFYENGKKHNMEQKIRRAKNKVRKMLISLFIYLMTDYFGWNKTNGKESFHELINYLEVLKFIDKDLTCVSSKGNYSPAQEYIYVQDSLDLLLKVLPLRALLNPNTSAAPIIAQAVHLDFMDNKAIDLLREEICETKSSFLESIKILFLIQPSLASRNLVNIRTMNQESPVNRLKEKGKYLSNQQVPEHWDKVVMKNLQWMMRESMCWNQWLAIFMDNYVFKNIQLLLENPTQLLSQILLMFKFTIAERFEQFWEGQQTDLKKGNVYELKILRSCLRKMMDQNGDAVSAFLPVLTKSLGNNDKYTRYTFQMMGAEGMRRYLTEKLERDLDFNMSQQGQNYGGSSLGMSEFYMQRTRFLTDSAIMKNSLDTNYQNSSSSQTVKPPTYYPEQELKFLSKATINCISMISQLESCLFNIDPRYSTGLLISMFFLKCLKKLREYKVGCLTCMRYVMKVIDYLFVYTSFSSHHLHYSLSPNSPRQAFLTALSITFLEEQRYLSQTSINKLSLQLQDMVSFTCGMNSSCSEQCRQAYKLKTVISQHVRHLIKLSKSLSEYFPLCTTDPEVEIKFLKLSNIIAQHNYSDIASAYDAHPTDSRYHPTPWLFTLLLSLQTQQLLPMDFQTIHFLLLKFRIPKELQKSSENSTNYYLSTQIEVLEKIVEILNKSTISEQLFSNLQPTSIKGFPLQLINKKYLLYSPHLYSQYSHKRKVKTHPELMPMQQYHLERHKYKGDESEIKRNRKNKEAFMQQKQIVIGNISGSLQIIGTVLELQRQMQQRKLQKQYALIQNVHFVQKVKQGIMDVNKMQHYSLSSNQTNSVRGLDILDGLEEIDTSVRRVNIVQVITSFINFQAKENQEDEKVTYLNKSSQISRELFIHHNSLVIPFLMDGLRSFNSYMFQANDMGFYDNYLTNDLTFNLHAREYSIGVGSVLSILSHLLCIDAYMLVYKSLHYADMSLVTDGIDIGMLDDRVNNEHLSDLLSQVVGMLGSQRSDKDTIVEFISLGFEKSIHFKQYMMNRTHTKYNRSFLEQLKTQIGKILKNSWKEDEEEEIQDQLLLLNRIALLIYKITSIEGMEPHFIHLPTSNMAEEILKILHSNYFKLAKNLQELNLTLNKNLPEDDMTYFLYLYRSLAQSLLLKSTLHLAIEALNLSFCHQSMQTIRNCLDMLVKMSDVILAVPPPLNGINLQDEECEVCVNSNNDICTLSVPFSHLCKLPLIFYRLMSKSVGRSCSYGMQYPRNEPYPHKYYNYMNITNNPRHHILNLYYNNHIRSLEEVHQHMFSSLLSFFLQTTNIGSSGHTMDLSSLELEGNELNKLKQYYKWKARGGSIWGDYTSQKCQRMLHLANVLIQYLQRQHEYKHSNDLLLLVFQSLFHRINRQLISHPHTPVLTILYSQFDNILIYTFRTITDIQQFHSHTTPNVILSLLLTTLQIYVGNHKLFNLTKISEILDYVIKKEQGKSENDCGMISVMMSSLLFKWIEEYWVPVYNPLFRELFCEIVFYCKQRLEKNINSEFEKISLFRLINVVIRYWVINVEEDKERDHDKLVGTFFTSLDQDIRSLISKYTFSLQNLQNNQSVLHPHALLSDGMVTINEFPLHSDSDVDTIMMAYLIHLTGYSGRITEGGRVVQWGKLIEHKKILQASQQKKSSKRDNHHPQQYKSVYATDNLQTNRKRSRSVHQKDENQCYLMNKRKKLNLQQQIELKVVMSFICSIVGDLNLWKNARFSPILEYLFIEVLASTNFILKSLLQVSESLSYSPRTEGEKFLVSITVNQENLLSYYRKNTELKNITLLTFTEQLHTLTSLAFYITSLSSCLVYSTTLTNFYSKILPIQHSYSFSKNSVLLVYDELTNILLTAMDYVSAIVKKYDAGGFSKTYLYKLLSMYQYSRNQLTDFSHQINFLNSFMLDLKEFAQEDQEEIPEKKTENKYFWHQKKKEGEEKETKKNYQYFLALLQNVAISIGECSVELIKTWEKSDWKSAQSNGARNGFRKNSWEWMKKMGKKLQWKDKSIVEKVIWELEERTNEGRQNYSDPLMFK